MTQNRREWGKHVRNKTDGRASPPPVEKYTTATPRDFEFKIQSGFIDWVRIVEVKQIPELRLLYAIPNGGARHPAVGGKMKREGVKRGVLDLHLPIARGGFHSLYLETKAPEYRARKDGGLSKFQVDFKDLVEPEGNLVIVCYSINELISAVTTYLDGGFKDE